VNLPLIPQDKANHAVYGAAIACVVSIFFGPYWALLAVCAVAVLKEVSDWWQNKHGGSHGVELLDAAATIAGGALVLLPQLLKGVLK
jgi:hypothetical protein